MKKALYLIMLLSLALSMTALHAQTDQAALLAKVEAMAKVGASYSPSFSPDGKEIVFISDMSGLPQVWKISSDGGWPSQLTNFNDPVSGVIWSPDGKHIAFQLAPGGGSNDVYLIDKDSNETLLTQHTGPGQFDGKFSANGDIYMASNLDRDKVAFGKVEGTT